MRHQKPANRKLRRSNRLRLIGLALFVSGSLFFSFLLPLTRAFAQTGRVMVGAHRLYVRRGPGAEFPPFATLTKGDSVEVQEVQGEWARIVTGGGQTGYVRSAFLVLPGERKKAAAPPPALPTPTAKPTPPPKPPRVATPEPAALRTANARNKALDAEVRELRQEIVELKGHRDVTPGSETTTRETPVGARPVTPSPTPTLVPPAGADGDQAQAEIMRLTALVERLQHGPQSRPPVEGLPASTEPGAGVSSGSSSALILGIVGVAIGWLAGSTLGRKSERSRRPRVRF